jgi:hypothetical protein
MKTKTRPGKRRGPRGWSGSRDDGRSNAERRVRGCETAPKAGVARRRSRAGADRGGSAGARSTDWIRSQGRGRRPAPAAQQHGGGQSGRHRGVCGAEAALRLPLWTGQRPHRAKAELIKAIDEINQTSLQQFQVTFEQIRKNFEYTFHTLFGGGRAHLELIQAEDILESGIEIVAQPPGTKLKGITLLSGGQKTLTAVALLFALYMVKPSPFCLLDELDAPLDESNIGRFTDLLKKFVNESQFIIITHNKRTVSAAQAIYGVTMEERGVSKTVSMRFNHIWRVPDEDRIACGTWIQDR